MKAVSIESLRAREPSLRDRISPLSCPPSSNTRHDAGSNSTQSKLERDIGYSIELMVQMWGMKYTIFFIATKQIFE